MGRKAKKGPTLQVNWRLPRKTYDRVMEFYGLNKIKLTLESDRDAADHLLNLALDGYKNANNSKN